VAVASPHGAVRRRSTLAIEGMRRGDFVIMTHPPVRKIADARAQDIIDAFDALS